MVKKIIFGLLGLIILLTLVGFLLPAKLEVSRSLTVNAPAEYAFEEVNSLENWGRWNYWNTLDTAMKITYGDQRIGNGAWYSWDSEKMGTGKVSITESTPFQVVKVDLDFMENGTANAWYDFQPEGEGTKVSMNFSQDFGMNPIGRWFGLYMKGELGTAFEFGLGRLKEISEAKPRFSVAISEVDIAPFTYIGIKHTMSPKDPVAIGEQMGRMYGQLQSAMKKAKVNPTGMPFCFYPSYSEESMDMVCAMPVDVNAKVSAQYPTQTAPGGRAIKAVHMGSYETLETTHEDISKYIEFRQLEMSGAPWEVYVTDPGMEPDTAKWVTEVYYPVSGKSTKI